MSSAEQAPLAVVAWAPNRLDIFALGQALQMFHKAWDGQRWIPLTAEWEDLGGRFSSPPAVAAWEPHRLDIFALDAGHVVDLDFNRQIVHKAWDGGRWLPLTAEWEPLGGRFTSPPAVASWAPHRLDIFGLGLDLQMFHKAWDGHQWLPSSIAWEALGGTFTSVER